MFSIFLKNAYRESPPLRHVKPRLARPRLSRCLRLFAGALLPLSAQAAASLYVDYSLRPNPLHLQEFQTCILSPEAIADLKPGLAQGNDFLAYLSLVEIGANASYSQAVRDLGVPFLGKNKVWNSDFVDISDPKWKRFVIESLAKAAWSKGFNGFFLDTVDGVETLENLEPARAAAFRAAMIDLVKSLRQAYPAAKLIINRGFRFHAELAGCVDGVLVESVFRTYRQTAAGYDYLPVPEAATRELVARVKQASQQGFRVFVIDYASPGDTAAAAAAHTAIRDLGAVPFVSTPDLQGTISGRPERVARRIVCLFGNDPKETEDHPLWPEDTLALTLLQPALEWMGYELDYHDAAKGLPTKLDMSGYCGVILDQTLNIPIGLEHAYLDWLLQQKSAGRKLIFLGNYAFEGPHDRARLLRALGIRGDSARALVRQTPRIAEIDRKVVVQPVPLRPVFTGFGDLSAPEGSKVFLGLELDGRGEGRNPRFDTIFAADWGGVILAPYTICVASEAVSVPYIDPFAFLAQIFPYGNFPAPDVTTRDGLRILYSHIDGDGFSSLSTVAPGKTCAEVLYAEVLKGLPWPITVSIVESELRGHMLQQKAGTRDQLETIAREIFRLSQVEPASHSYSHPFVWDLQDGSNVPLYPSLNLQLKPEANYRALDLRREIVGSLDYILKELVPAPDPARLIFWSGNCRPSLEALRLARDAGIENMNGGKTVLSKRFPGITGVAPKGVSQDGLMQVFASNQNEFYYTQGWTGPYNSGFGQVIETFEMTETPRRLKPVNVYYHFFSADRPAGLKAIQKIYAWCGQRPLRAMTAWEYAKLVRDSHATDIYQTGPSSWEMFNQGEHTAYRLPAGKGYPDLERSDGILGFNEVGSWIYVQTDGSRRVRLVLSPERPRSVYLKSSTAAIGFTRHGASATLEGKKWAANVELAGLPTGQAVSLEMGGRQQPATADADGVLALTLPAGSRCNLSF